MTWRFPVAVTICEGGANTDAMYAYRRAVSRFGGPKRQGKISPHMQFANAGNDRRLVKFVQEFGPVVVSFFAH